jgi:hypothetical protein
VQQDHDRAVVRTGLLVGDGITIDANATAPDLPSHGRRVPSYRQTGWQASVMTVRPSGYTRDEPAAERLDRNYAELLQEVRVAQTGVQILFAFLLALAFQPRFSELSTFDRAIYLVTLLAAAVAAILLIAPVAVHRILFRRRLKDELVQLTSRLAAGGLAFLLVAILGAVLLVVDLVSGPLAAAIAVSGLALVAFGFWYALPARWLGHPRSPD